MPEEKGIKIFKTLKRKKMCAKILYLAKLTFEENGHKIL